MNTSMDGATAVGLPVRGLYRTDQRTAAVRRKSVKKKSSVDRSSPLTMGVAGFSAPGRSVR
jgi:hypothetical protein